MLSLCHMQTNKKTKLVVKICSILFLGTFLFCACSSRERTETSFLQAESLLEEHPDSALQLLQTLPALQKLSHKESARYALLLARATDKCEKSLLPCDSLLNLALNYYDNDEKERAVALLYKGRLEIEINSTKEAIAHLQEALTILKDYPKEIEIKRHTLSSLGNLYFDVNYYDEAFKAYRELYKCCITDKDKSVALNSFSLYYCTQDQKDSAIIIQRKALDYALDSGDSSMIGISEFNLSIDYDEFEEPDSALYHARNAIKWFPKGKIPGSYYGHLGSLLYERGENKDSAIYYLNKNLEDTKNIAGRGAALLSLYDIEKDLGNYKAASAYLEEHVEILDSMYSTEQYSELQQLINKYNIKIHIREEQIKEQHRLQLIIALFIFCCLLIILFYQYHINKRKRIQLIYQQNLKQTQYKLSSMQTIIEDNQSIISLLQEEQRNLKQDQANKIDEIQERESTIERLRQEKHELRNWLFTQSDIYKKIIALSKQEVSDKKAMKVLTNAELKKLQKIIFEIYADYISYLQKKYPKLTEEDILYLCLNEAKLQPLTIALCFGYNNTHPINQRKLRIKERMKDEEM